MKDTVQMIWVVLDDGPAAGTVDEVEDTTSEVDVTLCTGESMRYVRYAAAAKHRIARYRLSTPP